MDENKLKELTRIYNAEQREDEVVWFHNHASLLNPKVVVEIGIKEGGNLKILSTLVDENGLVIGIDPRKEIPWKMDDSKCKVFHIVGNSHEVSTVNKLKVILDGLPIDVLFIDGDHSYEGMLKDFYDYAPLVRTGGIIAVHDIYYLEEVTRAWKDVPGIERFESPRNQSSIGIGFIIKEGNIVYENAYSLSWLND